MIFVIAEHRIKALSSVVTVEGIVIVANAEQLLNALSSMLSSPSFQVRFTNCLQLEKALTPIDFTVEGKLTAVKELL